MRWLDFLRKKPDQPEAPARRELPMAPMDGDSARMPVTARQRPDPNDPAVRERRRQRLERRIQDLGYDIRQAESALTDDNRWNDRIAQINGAIEQTSRDAEQALVVPPGWVGIPLPPWPVVITSVSVPAKRLAMGDSSLPEPSEVAFRVGDVAFRYTEDLDWAERGHQQIEPQLRRVEGDPAALMPPSVPPEREHELREHLAHGLSILAERVRDDTLDSKPLPELTLSDLASPCPECGGWRDLRGRCPACQERQWLAERLQAELIRLIKERNEQFDDLQRMRDRLPVLRRQLMDAEAEWGRTSPPAPLSDAERG
ncbi:MAG TPA: hypothetical protein VMM78_01130 [Thermomicrobiales bacterium]|nr:hypothetical protein [Thermomicrobiales bacterium]